MKKILLMMLASLLLFTSCGRFGNKEKDDKKDMRIVCLSKHLTEMVFALGKGHDISGNDRFQQILNEIGEDKGKNWLWEM